MIEIITLVGARPQFIKAAAVSRVIKTQFYNEINEKIVHTGQHYDENMSQVFFDELEIPKPHYNMHVNSSNHGEMTGRMLEIFESYLLENKADVVLVYGDTNSTLAGMLAAVKLGIPVAHVEAGLRSYNINMPEEINRILVDRISSLLFCPTKQAVKNLAKEGIKNGVHRSGDVMLDVAMYYGQKAVKKSSILNKHNLEPDDYILVTCHRAENTDNENRLKEILSALAEMASSTKIIFPIHPRTKKYIIQADMMHFLKDIIVVEPLPFLDMVLLEQLAKGIITDSGGVQKEAFFYGVPCITIRDETEWVETVESGWNRIVGANKEKILEAINSLDKGIENFFPYGDGRASENIIKIIKGYSC